MKDGSVTKILRGCLLGFLVVLTGCCINIGCGPRVKYERTVKLEAPLEAGSEFATQSHNGSVTINGCDVIDCNIIADIIARAGNEEDAKRIAEETKIKLERFGKKLIAKIEKPALVFNQSVSVNLDVTVPRQTDLQISTHNGGVKIINITSNIKATTHNGAVKITNTTANINATTHNGSISCKEISGDVKLKTHNGSITAVYSESAQAVCDVSMITHNGGVNFSAPPNFSAKVEASTHNGSITTNLPITVIGTVSKRKLTGTIGTGKGRLHLETHNGSIKIK
jgi:hypothetical protein